MIDSDGDAHTDISDRLKLFLEEEAAERKISLSPKALIGYRDVKVGCRLLLTNLADGTIILEVPQQNNGHDCGLFLLHFAELFLDDPHAAADHILVCHCLAGTTLKLVLNPMQTQQKKTAEEIEEWWQAYRVYSRRKEMLQRIYLLIAKPSSAPEPPSAPESLLYCISDSDDDNETLVDHEV